MNCTVKASGPALLLSTKDASAGYAIRKFAAPVEQAVFAFTVQRAPGTQRHGNAFFVCGPSDRPENCIECRLYYGGRSSMMITGSQVEQVEEKASFTRRDAFAVAVSIDCKARTVTFAAGGKELTARIAGPIDAITHYGYGGANSDNLFTETAAGKPPASQPEASELKP